MASSSSSTARLTTPPPLIEFNPPIHVAADGTIIESSKQLITIFDPSVWVTYIQSCCKSEGQMTKSHKAQQ